MSKQAFCLQWRTATMPAPSFMYYGDPANAEQHRVDVVRRGGEAVVNERTVPDQTPLVDERDRS